MLMIYIYKRNEKKNSWLAFPKTHIHTHCDASARSHTQYAIELHIDVVWNLNEFDINFKWIRDIKHCFHFPPFSDSIYYAYFGLSVCVCMAQFWRSFLTAKHDAVSIKWLIKRILIVVVFLIIKNKKVKATHSHIEQKRMWRNQCARLMLLMVRLSDYIYMRYLCCCFCCCSACSIYSIHNHITLGNHYVCILYIFMNIET